MASLLELLVARRMISPEQAREAAALADETGAFIGRILVSQGSVDEALLARFLAAECTERPGPDALVPDEHLARLLPERLMRNYRMVPLGRTASGALRLAVAEPLSIGGIDQVKRRLGMPVRLVLVDAATIDALLASVTGAAPPGRGGGIEPVAKEERPTSRPLAAHASKTVPPREAPAEPVWSRRVGVRIPVPAGWHPAPVESVPPELEAACQGLREMLARGPRSFVVLVGPDGARDLVLRRVCAEVWPIERILYLDLVAHLCPEDPLKPELAAVVVDGIDILAAEEEEERVVLRIVSTAYASHTPLVVGMTRAPKDAPGLSRGMRASLGLARVLSIEVGPHEGAGASLPEPSRILRALMDETIAWSDAAFPGASLRPLLEACARAYEHGNRVEAVAKAATSVASRLAHLCAERGR